MDIILNKFQIFIDYYKRSYFKRYTFDTATRERCLHCGDEIFIPFDNHDRKLVFCDDCEKWIKRPTKAQYMYMVNITNKQLSIIDKIYKNEIDNKMK